MNEQISIFDMFKIGIGPSSSHTLGPWRAAQRFAESLKAKDMLPTVERVKILLYGSLAKTGHGHGTDVAVILGLVGEDPVTCHVEDVIPQVERIKAAGILTLAGQTSIPFSYQEDLLFRYTESLPAHPNAVTFQALLRDGTAMSETYYSIGGGFVSKEGEESERKTHIDLPFPVQTARDLLVGCMRTGLKVSEPVMENEHAWRSDDETRRGVLHLFETMRDCIYRGCHTTGVLPGGLNVQRRAYKLNQRLIADRPYTAYDSWVAAIRAG